MLVETLVLIACLQNKGGCAESTDAYVKYNKDIQTATKSVEEYGKKVFKGKEWLMYVIAPAYAVASNQPANFPIYNRWVVGVDAKKQLVILRWSY